MEAATVSIITPTLNPGLRLHGCIDSVAGQDYPGIEHIVVDGGSTDETLERLSRSPITWISEPDNGQSHAIQKGIDLAQGEFVGWLNSDDELTPGSITYAMRALQKTGASVAYGNLTIVENGRARSRSAARRITRARMATGNPIPQPGSLLRKSSVEAVGGIAQDLHLCMDFDLYLRLFDAGFRFVHVDARLATFYLHPGSKSGSIPAEQWWDEFEVAWTRSGRKHSADIAAGRALFHRAAIDRDLPPSPCLRAGYHLEALASGTNRIRNAARVASTRCPLGILAVGQVLQDSVGFRFRSILRPGATT